MSEYIMRIQMPAVLCIMPTTSNIWNGLERSIFAVTVFLSRNLPGEAPALHDDLLSVTTCPTRVGGSSVTLNQKITRQSDGKLLADGVVTLACVSPSLKASRIPLEIRTMLEAELGNVG